MSMGGIQRWKAIQLCSTPEEGDGARKRALWSRTEWSSIESGCGRRGRAEATSSREVEPTTWALARHSLTEPPNPLHAIILAWARKMSEGKVTHKPEIRCRQWTINSGGGRARGLKEGQSTGDRESCGNTKA
jgi:hypothetical protein